MDAACGLATPFLVVLAGLSSRACANKEYQKCLEQVDAPSAAVAASQEKTDAAEKEQCANAAEVKKITQDDCDQAYKSGVEPGKLTAPASRNESRRRRCLGLRALRGAR